MRTIMHLNFDWNYHESFAQEMLAADYDDSAFATVQIPHTNKELPYHYFDEKIYQFVSCYRKHFTLPAINEAEQKRFLLHFEGAANYAVVYLNGQKAGEHKGGYTPFSLDITELAREGENVIAVMLDSTERKEIPPFGNVIDYLCYGGIYREVWLEVVDETYIENVFIQTKDVLAGRKLLEVDVTFNHKTRGELKYELLDGETVLKEHTCAFEGKTLKAKWRVSGVSLWDLDNPKLYTLRVSFQNDSVCERFGFREARFTKTGFVLNGKTVKIRGLNRHQSYPYVGYAMPASAQKADADLLKYTLGCNLVRTAHYPDSKHFLDRCDEIGLLVFTEMPSWQFTGEGEWRRNAIENVSRMVTRDRNHPSVILWGVRVNEGQDCDELYAVTNRLARALDPSRQTGGVRNFPRSHLLEDVYTYNDFSHSGGLLKLLPPAIVAGFKSPYLVTEYNGHMYPTKSFDNEKLRTEHALRHARVQNQAYGSERTSGAIGWCMADYNTHKDFGSGDRICYHGVTDMFRIPKFAAAVYASQQDERPVLELSSTMDIGEHPGGIVGQVYIFTNCDYVKIYKNGKYMSKAYPNKEKYPHLPHPPIFPEDYIGDALTEAEGLDPVTAKNLKAVLVAANAHGFVMPPQNYAKLVFAMLHGKLKVSDIVDIVTKYFANWGNEQVTYSFEGYKNGKCVKTIIKTAVNSIALHAQADNGTLCEKETYDVTRVALTAVDQNNNRLPFANHHVHIAVSGAGELIGPADFALIGGARAFWVKTNGKTGDIPVHITAENMPAVTLTLRASSSR
ncbi:MAG: beta galactosidase jelly roll domain-containing protein [Oscillospiraceae bacterium]|jgi:beta-galactosidase|nr:beta galactosidase jelly roll domain-containing protein [Oscillospiraceae bacterium]